MCHKNITDELQTELKTRPLEAVVNKSYIDFIWKYNEFEIM